MINWTVGALLFTSALGAQLSGHRLSFELWAVAVGSALFWFSVDYVRRVEDYQNRIIEREKERVRRLLDEQVPRESS